MKILAFVLIFSAAAHAQVWGPNVKVRAPKNAYDNYPKVRMRDQPEESGWWISPIHANLLEDGNVLLTGWARVQEASCPSHMGRQWPASFVLNISADSNVPLGTNNATYYANLIDEKPEERGGEDPLTPVDVLYCSGHTPLPDGKILFTGGARYQYLEFGGHQSDDDHEAENEYGLDYARIYDPGSHSFARVEQKFPQGPGFNEMKRIAGNSRWDWIGIYKPGMMWYPTNLRLPDGNVLVVGGFARQSGPFDPQFVNRGIAIFNPSTQQWFTWIHHKDLPSPMRDPAEVLNLTGFDYVHLFLLPKPVYTNSGNYHIAVKGGVTGEIGLLSLDPNLSEEKRIFIPPHGARPNSKDGKSPGASDTTSVMLPTGEIVLVGGGGWAEEGGQRIDVYNPYKDEWRTPVYTDVSRIRATATLLPNGEILIVNGEAHYSGNNFGDRRRPIIFNPTSGSFQILDPWTNDNEDRGYHNFSLLLKDGRILLGGGRTLDHDQSNAEVHRIGCERTDVRIYSPPYLWAGKRPELLVSKFEMKLGTTLQVQYDGPKLRSVVLMALGAETHHFDQNQRLVPLKFSQSDGTLTIHAPENDWIAPVGLYNLFVISESGAPSPGVSTRVTN